MKGVQTQTDDKRSGQRPTAAGDALLAKEAFAEEIIARFERDPGRYPTVGSLAVAAGISADALDELIRTHFQTTPEDLLTRLRVGAARRLLLEGCQPVAGIAGDTGFPSLEAFSDAFRVRTSMTPERYRELPRANVFVLTLPDDYPLPRILAYIGRDRNSLTERVEGQSCLIAYRIGEQPVGVRIEFETGLARCTVVVPASPEPELMPEVHSRVLRTLGLTIDPSPFEAQVSAYPELAPLVDGQRGLRVPLVAEPFDGLVWAIVGQQINLAFAYTLRRRLIERVSQPLGDGLFAPPSAHTVAALEPEDLLPLSFSRAKVSYLLGAARLVAGGELPLDTLGGHSATRIERTLLAVRGIGPWSAHYLMMRHFGFLDCVPLGDTGLTSGLQRFFGLAERPGRVETLALMERFRPYRSLATFHLWQRHGAVA